MSEVYDTNWLPAHQASQMCMIMMDSKGSYPMFVQTKNSYKDNFDSEYCTFIKNYTEQQLVENGRSSLVREVVTVDIDECYDVYTFYHKLKEINIPVQYCITQNRLTNHWQIQFHLCNPIAIKKLKWIQGQKFPEIQNTQHYKTYAEVTLKLAKFFKQYFKGSDFKYRGVLSRNIYNTNQSTYVIQHGKISRMKDCIGNKPISINFCCLVDWVDSLNIKLSKNCNIQLSAIQLPSDSRHELTLKLGREYIWSKLKDGKSVSEDDLAEYLLSLREEIGSACCKEPHDVKEILSQVHSIYDWSCKNFDPFFKRNSKNQTLASIHWNFNQRCNKIKKAARLKKQFVTYRSLGKNIQEIASLLNMSVSTLYSYLPLFAVTSLVATFVRNGKMFIAKSWENIANEISEKILELYTLMKSKGMRWSDVDFNASIEDYQHIIDYNIELNGNKERLAA